MRIQPSSLAARLKEEHEGKYWKIIPITTDNYTKYNLAYKGVSIGPFYADIRELLRNDNFLVNIYINKYAKKSYLYVRDIRNGYVGRAKLMDGISFNSTSPIPHTLSLNTWMCESRQKRIYKETKERMIAEDVRNHERDVDQYKELYDEIAKLTQDKEFYRELAEREQSDKKYLEEKYNEKYFKNWTKSDEELLENLKVKLSDISEEELLAELVRRVPNKPKAKTKPKSYVVDFQSRLEKELTNESGRSKQTTKTIRRRAATIRNGNRTT